MLINSTHGNKAEKDAKPNLTLGALDIIDDIKEELEKKCPGIVSCADILAIAARDAVSLVTTNKLSWLANFLLEEIYYGFVEPNGAMFN